MCSSANSLENGIEFIMGFDKEEREKFIAEITEIEASYYSYYNYFIQFLYFICGGLFFYLFTRFNNRNEEKKLATTHLIYTNSLSNGYNSLNK